MFESLAAWVLNSYIGDYLEKLNTEQLSLDLFQGQLELEDVPFKKNALRKFGVSIDIRSGIIGKLTLSVPLTRLRSDSWIITLSNVFLVLEPATCCSINAIPDAPNEEALSREVVNDLKLIAVQEKAAVDASSSSSRTADAASSSWWDYYGIGTIIDNIRLILNNVHIRYEHKSGSNATLNPFAAGCRIDRLCFQSTDFQWIPTFIVRNLNQDYYKSVIFDGLSVYWDCDETFRRAETYEDLKELLRDCNDKDAEIETEYDFVDVNTTDDKETSEKKISNNSKLSWLLDRASGAIHAQIKSSNMQNPNASTCLDFDVIINDLVRLSLEQIHYDNLLTLIRSFKDDYELEFDRNAHQNKAKVRRKSENNEKQNTELDKTKSNAVQLLISIQIPRLLLALKNYLTMNDKDDKSFVSFKAENLLIKYNGEESDLTSMEISASKFQIIDSFQHSSISPSSAYLLNVSHANFKAEDGISNNTACLSTSCPDLTSAVHGFRPITSSSSVQIASSAHADLSNSMFDDSSKRISRKISSRFEKNFSMKILNINRQHPKFLSHYNEVCCQVDICASCLDVSVNAETWILLLDFFGLIRSESAGPDNDQEAEDKMQIRLTCQTASFLLNAPGLQRLIANLIAKNLRVDILNETSGFTVDGKVNQISFIDAAARFPMYKEKLNVSACGTKDIEFLFFKYSGRDFELKRECDAILSIVCPDKLRYIHTQKFLLDFTSFWLQFAQLYTYYIEAKEAREGRVLQMSSLQSHGFRLKLTCDLSRSSLIIPECSLSSKGLLIESESVRINNYFRFANSEESSKFYDTAEDEFVCLQDVMEIRMIDSCLSTCRINMKDDCMTIKKIANNLLNKIYPLDITVVRNLDSIISRAVPDMEISLKLESVLCSMQASTFKIIKNILDLNFSETSSSSFAEGSFGSARQNPSTLTILSGKVWTNLLIMADLRNVSIDFYSTFKDRDTILEESKFGTLILNEADFSLESFSNCSKGVELICYSGRLVDCRFDDLPANKRGNVFPLIFSTSDASPGQLIDQKTSVNRTIAAELYFSSGLKGGSKVSVVLTCAKITLIMDWLFIMRDFILLPHSCNESVLRVPTYNVKSGVATRKPYTEKIQENYEFKINISKCELVFVENPSCRHSLATVLTGSWIIYYPSYGLAPSFSCDSVQIANCTMDNRTESETILTEPFSMTMENVAPEQLGKKLNVKLVPIGLIQVASEICEQKIEINVCDFLAKLSYRDWLVFSSVLQSYLNSLSAMEEKTEFKSPSTPLQTYSPFDKILLKLSSIQFLLLDDSHDHRLPLLKIISRNGEFEINTSKHNADVSTNFFGKLSLSIDFFNQNIYAWEPFVEPWRVENLQVVRHTAQNQYSVNIASLNEILNINVSRVFLDQLTQFQCRWPEVSQSVRADYRSSYHRRSDFLPYVLHNETGSQLWFRLENDSKTYILSEKQKLDQWSFVEVGQSKSFSFKMSGSSRSDPHDESADEIFVNNKITLRIDGWRDVTSVNVDSVGTFCRLSKLIDKKVRSHLLQASSNSHYAHIVVVVSKDNEGRKCVTIRSSLLFVNFLSDPLEISLENMGTFVGDSHSLIVAPGAVGYAPLNYVGAKIFARPTNFHLSAEYCKAISWHHVTQQGMVSECIRTCKQESKGSNYQMCVSVRREHFPDPKRYAELKNSSIITLPAHTITFGAPLTVLNLLPSDVKVDFVDHKLSELVGPGDRKSVVYVDILQPLKLYFSMESFMPKDHFRIDCSDLIKDNQSYFLEMLDHRKRSFILHINVEPLKAGGLKITTFSPFWIINKSGLPLIFKQEGSSRADAAGQFSEHECAKSAHPMIFSFSDREAPQELSLRVGKQFLPAYHPLWCRSFALDPGVTRKILHLESTQGKPPTVYNIGVEVKCGQGLYKNTKIVLFTPLYTLNNRSSYDLFVAQRHDITKDGPSSMYKIASNSYMAWHWSRQDVETLLCVKRADLSYWSCGFFIDQIRSFHLTMRDHHEQPHFLRVEIVLHGATYFVTFLDADTFPSPIRIENNSDVPILYKQKGCADVCLNTILSPKTKVDYSWDDQLKPNIIVLTVQSAKKSMEYDLNILGQQQPLIYENYFHIAFSCSFENWKKEVCDKDIVLDVLDKGKVILNKKDFQKRSQLWRMTADGHLVNLENQKTDSDSSEFIQVLDILNVCDPKSHVPLMLRRIDARRRLTQQWSFTEDGYLVCGLQGMCVQALEKSFRYNSPVVLGSVKSVLQPSSSSRSRHLSSEVDRNPLPMASPECAVVRQRQKAGSGTLNVSVFLDGPTRVLRISDILSANTALNRQTHLPSRRYSTQSPASKLSPVATSELTIYQKSQESTSTKINFSLHLEALAFSVITAQYEELLYCQMRGFSLAAGKDMEKYYLSVSVLDLQADNQLSNFDRWHFLYIWPRYDDRGNCETEAFRLEVQWTPTPLYDNFETFIVCIGETALYIDEIFLWKFVQFLNLTVDNEKLNAQAKQAASVPKAKFLAGQLAPTDSKKIIPACDVEPLFDPKKARRCYFGNLSLSCRRLHLSVMTSAGVLPSDLKIIKQQFNVPLVRFENASVELAPFQQMYCFETFSFLSDAIGKHLQQQLTSQAMKILGTVDFLGNPIGLFQDLSGGLCELIVEGNVTNFVRDVWHGFSNSAAKLASSASEGVGKISMDENHRRMREAHYYLAGISSGTGSSGGSDALGHFIAGVKGLGIGILGGVVSLPANIYDGGRKDGLGGAVLGAGKGIVGTVTKPVQGVLDFATGTAVAAKDIVGGSQQIGKFNAARLRSPRVTRSVHGTLPTYSVNLAVGQEVLRSVSSNAKDKICMAMHQISEAPNGESLHALISNKKVYFVKKRRSEDYEVVLKAKYSDLINCQPVNHRPVGQTIDSPRLEIVTLAANCQNGFKKSLVKCSSLDLAVKVCRTIMYAKEQFDDQQRCLPVVEDTEPDL